jgi:peptidyl-tRNA hydrolase
MLGSDEYWRVRVGVDNREDKRISGEEYVLNRFMKNEVVIIEEVIGKVTNELVERLELTR